MDKPCPPRQRVTRPYLVFAGEIRQAEELKAPRDPPPPFSAEACEARVKAVRAQWDALSEEQKQPYKDKAVHNELQFPLDVAEYKEALAKWKSESIPPMPASIPPELQTNDVVFYAELIFCQEHRPMETLDALLAESNGCCHSGISDRLERRWKRMTLQERYPCLYEAFQEKSQNPSTWSGYSP
eukprot:GILK01005622.1.p1 GENE.GILK01005622.1~~GILK01005622.1.p1  ORF type:complete len:198 (-),score=22.17 GILK01005622.1:60-611(-)